MEIIKLNSANNIRDLGGTITKDGRKIKKGMLIRGRTLYKLSQKDKNKLITDYNLKTIIDLRCNKEIQEKPADIIQNTNYVKHSVSEEGILGISHEEKIHSFTSLYMMPQMEKLYVDLVSGECKKNIINTLKTILYFENDDYSVYYHCSAGKDRTGILTALLLSFFNVDRDLIIKDYLYTNRYMHFKAFGAFIGLTLYKRDIKLAKKIRLSLLARKEFLIAALDKLEQEYGSITDFFLKELNITPEEKIMLENKFLI